MSHSTLYTGFLLDTTPIAATIARIDKNQNNNCDAGTKKSLEGLEGLEMFYHFFHLKFSNFQIEQFSN